MEMGREQASGKTVPLASRIDDISYKDDVQAWISGDFVKYFLGMSMHYRSKWCVLHGGGPIIFAVGVFGQNLLGDRKNQTVVATKS
jgi:hypothetical protein